MMEISITLTDASGALLTGKANSTQIKIRRIADSYLLDFNDLTFKNSGWVSISGHFVEIDSTNLPGQYKKVINTTGWVDGIYKYLVQFDDGTSLQNFAGEETIAGGVVVPAISPVSGMMEISITLTDASGALLTGKANSTQIKIRRIADSYLLDFNDLTFKNSGWVSISGHFVEIDSTNLPGQYKKVINTTGWVGGIYKYLAQFDDGTSLQNFAGEETIAGSVVVVPAIPPVTPVTPVSGGVAGALLRARVATHLNRTDLTAQIETFCYLAVKELETNCLWFQLTSTTVLTVASQGHASLPLGFIKMVKDGLRDTSGTPLTKTVWSELDYWQTYSAGTGEPDYYAIADKIYFYSIPNGVYSLPIQYYRKLGFPLEGYDNAWTDEVWDLTFWTVLKHAWIYLRNIEEQGKCEKEIVKCLARYRLLSGKMTGKGRVTYHDF